MKLTNFFYYKKYEYLNLFHEIIKYDFQFLKFPLSGYFLIKTMAFLLNNKPLKAIRVLSQLYRTGWWGSKTPVIFIVNRLFHSDKFSTKFKERFIIELVKDIQPLPNTEKFFKDPSTLFNGTYLIIRKKTASQKGVIIINYNCYFSLFFKLFDVNEISKNYHIVLEPSWAGACEEGILAFATLNTPIFVMAYEKRDIEFIKRIDSNLIPIILSANWWVNHNVFNMNGNQEKKYDIIIVAAWGDYKRHFFIFRALRKLKKRIPSLSVVCIGYPGNLTLCAIKNMTKYFNLENNISFYEWLSTGEVSNYLRKSKVNLLWSRFEGFPRVIIEGMFCNVPCVLREGFNFGDKYPYINKKTGRWATESTLPDVLEDMINNNTIFTPFEYISKNQTCLIATEILNREIQKIDNNANNIDGCAVKVNELHGMFYLYKEDELKYIDDIREIMTYVKSENV